MVSLWRALLDTEYCAHLDARDVVAPDEKALRETWRFEGTWQV